MQTLKCYVQGKAGSEAGALFKNLKELHVLLFSRRGVWEKKKKEKKAGVWGRQSPLNKIRGQLTFVVVVMWR